VSVQHEGTAQSAHTMKTARQSRALSDLQVDAGACLQQNGDAAQVACMEHKECLYNTRRLCNQAHTAKSARKGGALSDLQVDAGLPPAEW